MSLWGNIKGKVKKLGSSSRSRSSRASSGSRDDMSVDSVRRPSRSQEEEEEAPASLAVSRPRLKIRVLTSVDQIVVRTDYERDALELLKKQSYGHAKRFDTEFLMMTGLRQDMNHAFTAMGWSRLTDITKPVRTFSPWSSCLRYMLKPLEKKLKSRSAFSMSSLKCYPEILVMH